MKHMHELNLFNSLVSFRGIFNLCKEIIKANCWLTTGGFVDLDIKVIEKTLIGK